MINGRILVTQYTEAAWLKEALARDQESKAGSSMPYGWSVITDRIDAQCENWDFGPEDKKLLTDHMWELYRETRMFLELDL